MSVANQLDSLKRAHRALYDEFEWVSDQINFQRPEHWGRPRRVGSKLRGDCDDFSAEIDHRTSNLVPIAFRRFCVCRTDKRKSTNYDHCVLAFIVDDDIWISDCTSPTLKLKRDLDYDMWAWNKGSISDPWESF